MLCEEVDDTKAEVGTLRVKSADQAEAARSTNDSFLALSAENRELKSKLKALEASTTEQGVVLKTTHVDINQTQKLLASVLQQNMSL